MKLNTKKIMVVDDEIAIAALVGEIISDAGYQPVICHRGKEAIKAFQQEKPFLIFSDLTMPKMNGVELLHNIRKFSEEVNYIIMTGYGTIESAVEAIRIGADDYIQKPLCLDYIRHIITKSSKTAKLIEENHLLKKKLNEGDFPDIVGKSEELESLLKTLKKAAESEADVMICGESGTGKEMLAHSIHTLSSRKDKAFVAMDCVALPPSLFESEIFGYEKGAFTGAEQRRDGLLIQANGGTLFIDEITELNYDLQAKLLRVLQERQFRRVGGHEVIKIDIRIVTATRRDPLKEVEQKRFRDDLYYRLSVIPLQVPALRERKSDIPFLIQHFLEVTAKKNNSKVKTMQTEVIDALERYDWPGNIRELKNIVERMYVLSGKEITFAELPNNMKTYSSAESQEKLWDKDHTYREGKDHVLNFFTRSYFSQLFSEFRGNVSLAAKKAGLSRKAFYDLMNKYDIKK